MASFSVGLAGPAALRSTTLVTSADVAASPVLRPAPACGQAASSFFRGEAKGLSSRTFLPSAPAAGGFERYQFVMKKGGKTTKGAKSGGGAAKAAARAKAAASMAKAQPAPTAVVEKVKEAEPEAEESEDEEETLVEAEEPAPAPAAAARAPPARKQAAAPSKNGRGWSAEATAGPGTERIAVPAGASLSWEMDFYSRPLVDEEGKRVWELLVCDSTGTFRYAETMASGAINATALKEALARLVARVDTKPRMLRYFRQSMTNTIRMAVADLGIVVRPSRRAYAIIRWVDERMHPDRGVYARLPNFSPTPKNPFTDQPLFMAAPPLPLPDALLGEKWTFLSLRKGDLEEIIAEPREFSELCPFNADQRALAADTMVPGVVLYSKRAKALAGWMSSVELAFMTVDREPGSGNAKALIMETGVQDRWLFSNLSSPQLREQAETFMKERDAAAGLHFVAIQSPVTDEVPGLWVLEEMTAPASRRSASPAPCPHPLPPSPVPCSPPSPPLSQFQLRGLHAGPRGRLAGPGAGRGAGGEKTKGDIGGVRHRGELEEAAGEGAQGPLPVPALGEGAVLRARESRQLALVAADKGSPGAGRGAGALRMCAAG
eukprot:tig00000622_g2634.t1